MLPIVKYTMIRLSLKDKKKLEKLSKLMGSKSLAETLRYELDIAEREFDKYRASLDSVLSLLNIVGILVKLMLKMLTSISTVRNSGCPSCSSFLLAMLGNPINILMVPSP